MRYLRGRSGVQGARPTYSWIDMFLVIVLHLAKDQGSGATPEARLPELRLAEAAAGAKDARDGDGHERDRVVLGLDGKARHRGVAVEASALADRLAATVPADRTIELAVETHSDGSGPLAPFLQIQSDLSRRGLWGRTETLYRPVAADAGPDVRAGEGAP